MKYLQPLLLSLWFLSALQTGCAQGQSTITVTTSPAPVSPLTQSLAAALITTIPPRQRVYLTVRPEAVTLPPDTAMPPPQSSLTTVTDAYQRSVRAFGSITAIAPSKMVLLNMHPETPDIYGRLQPEQAFKLLAGSLNDGQWRSLTSQDGLGLSDLTSEDQHRFFQAIFPNGSLQVIVTHPIANAPDGPMDLSNELPQVRLRLGQLVQISLPAKGQPNSYLGNTSTPEEYQWSRVYSLSFGNPQGIQLESAEPNVLKPGQLDWNLPALRVLVPLSGLKTVDDLVTRISQMTRLELYADPHFGKQSLIIIGENNLSAPASDLLRCLAYCVTGAFRQVAPAYVLTDDVVGVATRRTFLNDFSQSVSLLLKQKLTEAGDTLATKRSLQGLSGFSDPLAPTAAQWKDIQRDSDPNIPWMHTDLPMDQLTSAQKSSIQQEAQRLTQMAQQNPDASLPTLDMAGKMHLQVQIQLEFLVPSLESPIATNFTLYDLFQASSQLQRTRSKAAEASKPPKVLGPPSTMPEAMALATRRAVLVQPHSLADMDRTLALMKRLGFNQLWLDVFSGGQSHLASTDGGVDLLAAAIKKTRGTGVQVYAVMDLFGWDESAPRSAVDLTVLGETSAQDDVRQQQNALAEADANGDIPPPVSLVKSLSVTPVAPDVQSRLITLVRDLARRHGLAGIVLRNTAPRGYNQVEETLESDASSSLGYNLWARVAFLRQQHVDPIDVSLQSENFSANVIFSTAGSTSQIDFSGSLVDALGSIISLGSNGTNLPNFDDRSIDETLSQAWDKYRSQADIAVMRALFGAAASANPAQRPAIWVEQRRNKDQEDWYGLWTSPKAPLPEWRLTTTGGGRNQIDHLAKSESPLAMLGLDTDDLQGYTGLAALIHHRLLNTIWDGFALDLTLPNAPTLETLAHPAKINPPAK